MSLTFVRILRFMRFTSHVAARASIRDDFIFLLLFLKMSVTNITFFPSNNQRETTIMGILYPSYPTL